MTTAVALGKKWTFGLLGQAVRAICDKPAQERALDAINHMGELADRLGGGEWLEGETGDPLRLQRAWRAR